VPKVIGDDGVDVRQRQGVVGANHAFRRHTVLVLLDDEVEADATIADADDTPLVRPERRKLGMKG